MEGNIIREYNKIDFYDRLRVEKVIHLDSILPNVEGHEGFEDLFYNHLYKTLKSSLPELFEEKIECVGDFGSTLDINGRSGYVVKVSSPIRQYESEDLYYSGWGKVRQNWFYGQDIKEILIRANKWVKYYHKKDKEKLRGKANV